MNLTIPIKFEIRGKATSTYSLDTIERRLAVLAERNDQAAKDEIEFLENLKRKEFAK